MNFLSRFRRDRRGVSWVLATAALSIGLMPIIDFPLSLAWDQFSAVALQTYTPTGVTANALTVVQFIASYIIAFTLIGTVAWSIIQAKARRYEN